MSTLPFASGKLTIPKFSSSWPYQQITIEFENSEINFCFGLFPKSDLSTFKDDTFVYLFLNKKEKLKTRCKISILDDSDKPCYSQEYLWNFDSSKGLASHVAKFLPKNILTNQTNGWIKNDCLKLFCEVFEQSDEQDSIQIRVDSKICKALQNLLENGKLSDVTLVVGKKTYNVHKAILSARSPVFAAMFEHDCEEKRQNRVEITDIDIEVFDQFLHYLYTEQVDKLDKYAGELMMVADKYQMDCLRSHCENYLHNSITLETVTNFLMMADLYDLSELKTKCMDYFADHSADVMQTESWKEMEKASPKLLIQLLQKLAIKK